MSKSKEFIEHVDEKRKPPVLAFVISALSLIFLVLVLPNLYWMHAIKSGSNEFSKMKLDDAANYFSQAIWISRFFPKADDRLPKSLNILAKILIAQGKYEEASNAIAESIKISKRLYKKGSEEGYIEPLLLNASLSKRLGDYDTAVKIYDQILSISKDEKLVSPIYKDTLKEKSILEILTGDYDKAEAGLKEVNQLNEKLNQNTITNVSEIAYNLGRIQEARGNYKSALEFYNKAIMYLAPQIDKYKSAQSLIFNLKAELLMHEYKIDEAEPLVSKAFSLSQNPDNTDYLQVAKLKSIVNLTTIYLEKGNLDKAKKIIKKSFPIAEEKLGKGHPLYSKILSQRALLLALEGNFKEAKALTNKSKTLVEKTVGSNHRFVAAQTSNLAHIETLEKNYSIANDLYQNALATYKNCLGDKHPEYALCQIGYSNCLEEDGKLQEAEQNRSNAVQVFALANKN